MSRSEGGGTPLLNKQELQSLGVQLVVCPLTALYASAKAMQDMFDLIKTTGTTRQAMDRLLWVTLHYNLHTGNCR